MSEYLNVVWCFTKTLYIVFFFNLICHSSVCGLMLHLNAMTLLSSVTRFLYISLQNTQFSVVS